MARSHSFICWSKSCDNSCHVPVRSSEILASLGLKFTSLFDLFVMMCVCRSVLSQFCRCGRAVLYWHFTWFIIPFLVNDDQSVLKMLHSEIELSQITNDSLWSYFFNSSCLAGLWYQCRGKEPHKFVLILTGCWQEFSGQKGLRTYWPSQKNQQIGSGVFSFISQIYLRDNIIRRVKEFACHAWERRHCRCEAYQMEARQKRQNLPDKSLDSHCFLHLMI